MASLSITELSERTMQQSGLAVGTARQVAVEAVNSRALDRAMFVPITEHVSAMLDKEAD